MRRAEALVVTAGIGLAGLVLVGAVGAPAPKAAPVLVRQTQASAEAEVVEFVVPPPAAPHVDELPDAVAGVLAERGHTELLSQAALLRQLPPNVVGVLIEHDAVLRMPEAVEAAP